MSMEPLGYAEQHHGTFLADQRRDILLRIAYLDECEQDVERILRQADYADRSIEDVTRTEL